MRAKEVEFEVTYINLQDKPDWFLEISPHGKVPLLKVDEDILFESNAIAEFLDEMVKPQLHPKDPIERAHNRAWTDFTSDFASALNSIGYAKTQKDMLLALESAPKKLQQIETALKHSRRNNGPYFNGDKLSLVDAAYAPFLQRYCLVDKFLQNDVLKDFPYIKAWCDTLLSDERITGAVPSNFELEYIAVLKRRQTYAATLLEEKSVA